MSVAQTKSPPLRRVAFYVLAAFILLAPAVQQIFHIYLPVFRPWVMYSGVGFGLLRGDFEVTRPDGSERLSPEDFLGIRYYSTSMSPRAPHAVLDKTALIARIETYCDANLDVISVTFEGEVSGPRGWSPISAVKVCAR